MKVMCINDKRLIHEQKWLRFGDIYTALSDDTCICSDEIFLIKEFPDPKAGELIQCGDCGKLCVWPKYRSFLKSRFIPIDDKETRDAFEKLNQLDKVKEAVK